MEEACWSKQVRLASRAHVPRAETLRRSVVVVNATLDPRNRAKPPKPKQVLQVRSKQSHAVAQGGTGNRQILGVFNEASSRLPGLRLAG